MFATAMKKFHVLILLFISLLVQAQDSTSIATTNKSKEQLLYNHNAVTLNNLFNEDIRQGANNRLTVDFDFSANSNSAPMGIPFALLFKNSISNALKDRTDKRIKNQMLYEDMMKTGFTYRRYLTNWDGEVFFSYQHRQLRNIVGNKQAFELLFYGNAQFAGQTADLSNTLFRNFIYNQYTGGIKKKIDYGKYQMDFGMGFSFLQVINHLDVSTKSASVYTAPDGDTIRINYDLTYNTALEGATKFFQLNGLGGSGDFHLGFMNKDKWKLSIDLSDVGFMMFRKRQVNYTASKSVEFRGIVIPDLLHFTSATFDTMNLDSTIRSYLPTKTNNQYSLFFPFTISAVFSKPLLNNRLVLNFGIQYRHLPRYYVYGYVKANYFIKPDMVVSVSGGGGGYSLFNLGIDFSKRWKYFDLSIGTPNFIGLILPNHYTGTGLYLRLASSF